MRLAAMSLHGMLGAATSAIDSFDALDIKHIQHDTLSGKRLCNDPKCTTSFCPCYYSCTTLASRLVHARFV